MKHFFTTKLLACLAVLLLLWPSLASAAPFAPGNLVVVRIGDGSAALTSAATATFLLEYTPAGVLVQTIALPTAAAGSNSILTNTGSSTSDALLTRSADGRYLVLTGYDAAVGTTSLTNTTAATNNRIIGRVAADGTVDTSTRLGDAFSGSSTTGVNIRSAATVDGTSFYAVGSNSGVRYVPFGNSGTAATTALNTAVPTNNRGVNIFGGNLYVSSASGAFQGISQVGTGLPTTGPQTITQLAGFPAASGPQPYGFYFADLSATVPGVDVVYVADDRINADGGIQKWSLVGSTWTLNGNIANNSATALRGLDGATTGSTVALVASGTGGLYLVSDNAGYNAAPSTTTLSAPLATAGTNGVFRGAAFAPVAGVTTPAPTITSFTPTSGGTGATVTITGTDLTGATAVTLNGVAITGFVVVNTTTITFMVPATAATGPIAVTTPGGTATSTGTFTFVPAASTPTISSFAPASGPVGTTVTVTGTNFTGATGATLNGLAVNNFTVTSATAVTFDVPTGATSGPIAVTTPSGTATSSASFTVTVPVAAPTITGFTPTRALAGVGFTLTVNGTNLVAGTTISFNGATYPGTVVGTSGTSLTVVIPASGVPVAGSYPITATNGGGTSAALSFLVVAPATTVAFEDFEQGTKGAYATGTVTLRSGDWTFTDALLGSQFNDRVNQIQAARIRGGSIAMNFDKPNGAGVITLNAALYGTDATASFVLEISGDGGATYTTVPGAPAALTTTLTPYSFTVNRPGNVRLRISSTNTTSGSNPRINIDDINITSFVATGTLASQALPGLTVFPNPATDRITVALPTVGAATVALRDLTGRLVLAPAVLGADQQLRLPTSVVSGVYFLEVRQGGATAVRRVEKK
ncbi:IPT/TIG domain-containing protein [Hymenobacter terrenus]|uniref:IPT/TIG domain-containing protein n=1 Tax=Hymenobacter terrenus TaxID=1629124 RepID=UPI000695AF17|nr:IPT/TIG domain-containing protein [Hymenobacter terrenus]